MGVSCNQRICGNAMVMELEDDEFRQQSGEEANLPGTN